MKTISLSIFCVFFIFALLFIVRGRKLFLDPVMQCQLVEKSYKSENKKNFEISTTHYSLRKKDGKSKRAILLLPPTGGRNIIDEGYAYMFCKQGFDVVILEDWTGDRGVEDYVLDFGIHQRYMTRTQEAIELVLRNMDYDDIGVLGTSAGAINFSVSLQNEFVQSKVKSFFNIVGGMPLCHVIATAGEKGLEKVRAGRFKEFNFKNMAEYTNKICSVLSWDVPETIPDDIKFGMFLAKKDDTVPYALQKKQEANWRPRVKKELNSNHIRTVIKSYLFHRKEILNFFM